MIGVNRKGGELIMMIISITEKVLIMTLI